MKVAGKDSFALHWPWLCIDTLIIVRYAIEYTFISECNSWAREPEKDTFHYQRYIWFKNTKDTILT